MMKSLKNALFAALFLVFVGVNASFALEYYGYFAITIPGYDGQSEVADHSNVVWIHNVNDTNAVSDALDDAALAGKKAIVSLTPVFQNWQTDESFNNNWPANWTWWVSQLTPHLDTIIAFYPFDEPEPSKITIAETTTMVNAIRAAFPGRPIAVIYGQHVEAGANLFDWVGIDCYSDGDFDCDGTGYTYAYSDMRLGLQAGQKIMIVPQSGYPNSSVGCCDNEMIEEADLLHDIAYGDPKVIGIFPFLWQDLPGIGWTGVESLAALKPVYNEMGRATINNWNFPNDVHPLYRFRDQDSGNYFVTKNVTEGIDVARPNDFVFQGNTFEVFSTAASGRAPLYRCRTHRSNFVSRYSNCEGYTYEGILGYVETSYIGTEVVPLYRFVDPNDDAIHLSTTSWGEGTGLGYSYLRLQGYVPDTGLVAPGC